VADQLAVIQGTSDIGKKLSEHELQRTMDFCKGKHLYCQLWDHRR
jgi:hypothetical protein